MKVTFDGIGYVIEQDDIIRRYCNFTKAEAIKDFKEYMYLTGRGKPVIA